MRQGRVPLLFRLALDAALALLLAVALGARLTGEWGHEWTGAAFLALAAVHLWINRGWVAALFSGRYPARRVMNLAVNLGLMVLTLLLAWGGLMNSRVLLALWELEGGMGYREVHTAASWWLLLVTGLHIGLQWDLVAGWLRRTVPRMRTSSAARAGWPSPRYVPALVLTLGGLWSFHDRDMAAKLFQGFGFDYWDPDRPLILFPLAILSIMGLYAMAARLALRLTRWLGKPAGAEAEVVQARDI